MLVKKSRYLYFSTGGIILVALIIGNLWQSNNSKAASGTVVQSSTVKNQLPYNQQATNQATPSQAAPKQPTVNGKPITANDWHPVGPFYFAKGTIAKIEIPASPPEIKGSIWTDVYLKIDAYTHSNEPTTQDDSMKIGSISPITFYDYVDKGKSHLHEGDQVVMKIAQYTTPAGKIIWGCKYDDIYYKTNNEFLNNTGNITNG